MKLLFAPIGIAGGLAAGFAGKKLFELAWARVSAEEPPEPEHREAEWGKLVAALALEGAIFRVTRGIAERGARLGYERLTGRWPGEERPKPAGF